MLRLPVLALATFGASLVGGLALGGYTVGGFRMHAPPPDILRELSGGDADYDGSWPEPAPAPINYTAAQHVCKGCDAGLYRDEWRYADYDSYDPYAYDAPYPDQSAEPAPAWDEVRPATQTASWDDERPAERARRTPAQASRDNVRPAVDWAAVMGAYDVSLPVVARAEAKLSPPPQSAKPVPQPARQPVSATALEAPVVSVAALEAPAVVVGLRSR